MLFFLNLDGTVTRSDTDHVYQGQNKVANVELFTLISPAQAAIQVAFTLPNGLTTTYAPMSYVGAYSVDENNQKQVHHWKLAVPYNVTEVEGQVGVSFNVLLNDGTSGQTLETINQTTYTSSFIVEYSALPIPPTTATEDELGQLLDLLDKYYAQNASLAAKQPFVVGTVNTNTLGANQQASVAVEQSAAADSNGNYPTNFDFGIPQGTTFTPSVDDNGNISWSNDGGKANPVTKNIKGVQGERGATPDIEMQATVDANIGTPSVAVEKSGTAENPKFTLAFSNIKGERGADANHITVSKFNQKLISMETIRVGGAYRDVNDWFFVLATYTGDDNKTYQQLAGCKVIEKGSTTSEARVMSILDLPLPKDGTDGKDGAQGVGVKSITSGTPTVVNDKTNTPITITLTDNTTIDLVVSAENGKDGTSATVDIVQATGQSTTAVMSQKAVTDELNKKANSADLATVATSGNYNDLLNKPTIPTDYVPNTRKVNNKALSSDITLGASDVGALPTAGGTVTGNLTVGGNLTVNGTTTTVDSTTLQVKDKLIEVAHGNTATLTTPAGLVAPKYDGTNSGALVFDSTGTAYVGDVTLKDGNIDVANSGLQPLATRTGLVGGNLVQYDSSAQTLKDSGKKISDLATTSQVNAKYTKPSGGIPKTDLASDVQTSLGKADSALQSDALSAYAKKSDLAQVATSGNYNDLSNKPTIPTDYVKYTAQTLTDAQKSQARSNIGAGTSNFDGTWGSLSGKPNVVQSTGNSTSDVMSQKAVTDELAKKATTSEVNAKYTKPSDGIPKSDLASSVQTSLGKADTALQSAPVTSVNGETGDVTVDTTNARAELVTIATTDWVADSTIAPFAYKAAKTLTTYNMGGYDAVSMGYAKNADLLVGAPAGIAIGEVPITLGGGKNITFYSVTQPTAQVQIVVYLETIAVQGID